MINCKHINDEGVLQFEITHKQGQSPNFICKNCHGMFSQNEASAIAEGLL